MAAPPPSSIRACAACGNPVDPLRAPVVAILDGRFAYFCSVECKQSTSAMSIAPPQPRSGQAPTPRLLHELEVVAAKPQPQPLGAKPQPQPVTSPESESESESDSDVSAPPPRTLPSFAMREAVREDVSPSPVAARTVPEPPRTSRIERARALPISEAPVEPDEPTPAPVAEERESPFSAPLSSAANEDRDGRTLRVGSVVFGLLAVAVILLDARADALRLSLASLAVALQLVLVAIAAHRGRRASAVDAAIERDLGGPLLPAALAGVVSVGLAWALGALGKPGSGTAIAASAWVVLAATSAELVAHLSMRSTLADARAILAALDPSPATGGRTGDVGDVLEIAAGDRLAVDVVIESGALTFELWGSPAMRARRAVGAPVPAGSVVREGNATARVVATGRDRAFARLLVDAIERSDRASPGLRTLDRWAPWIALSVVVVGTGLGLVSRGKLGPTVVAGIVAAASILVPPARRLGVRDQLRGIVEACRRGAAFRDGGAFGLAGRVRSAVFCARGTIVTERPDTLDVEEVPGVATANDVLALAAGAELGVDHPLARKIVEAAEARGLRPVDVRNREYEAGLGVTGALAPASPGSQAGAPIVVGGRALCLRAHVPTAEHEARISDLEQRGRDVVLVARGGRVLGLVVLHSSLRAGALAAVQRVQDVEVDPVLLGGGARDRLEAIGRAVGVEHVRPEILPDARGAEVRRIAQSGGPVAVFGRTTLDAAALTAADVSVAFDDAGSREGAGEGHVHSANDVARPASGGSAIALAHDQLVPAVDVLSLTQATRARVVATLTVGLAPVALAALPVAFGLVRVTWAPLAALAATVALGVRDLVAAALPEGGRMDDNR